MRKREKAKKRRKSSFFVSHLCKKKKKKKKICTNCLKKGLTRGDAEKRKKKCKLVLCGGLKTRRRGGEAQGSKEINQAGSCLENILLLSDTPPPRIFFSLKYTVRFCLSLFLSLDCCRSARGVCFFKEGKKRWENEKREMGVLNGRGRAGFPPPRPAGGGKRGGTKGGVPRARRGRFFVLFSLPCFFHSFAR